MKLMKLSLVLLTASLLCSCKASESTTKTPEPTTASASKAVVPTAGSYDQCHSQSSTVPDQRAPSFLSQEQVCLLGDTQPARSLAQRAGEGHINEKGDCAFAPSGISCHFHTAQEFLDGPTSHELKGVGELHCIVPTNEPNKPVVYGARIRCKGPSQLTTPLTHGEEEHMCKSDMMQVFSQCSAWKCCDEGTLTNPITAQSAEQRAVHPHFHNCADEVLELDCGLLAHMHGHEANAPALGGVVEPLFNPSEP